jgi:hypothetical protein
VNVDKLQTSTEILQDLNEGFDSPHFLTNMEGSKEYLRNRMICVPQ